MNDHTLLGPWIRRFLLEHVVAERNLARNTQHSYRDAVGLVIPFVAKARKKPVDRLDVIDVSADLVRLFLADIETSRHCSIATRNQRLAAIRAFASFVGEHSPIHIEWSGQVRSIPFKKTGKAVVPYLDKPEMDALLAAPDCRTAQGRREHALLLFLYNSGARATEAAQLKIADLDIRAACVRNQWKGRKAAPLPFVAGYRRRNRQTHRRTGGHRTRLFKSDRTADHPVRHPHHGRAQHLEAERKVPSSRNKARQPPFYPSQHGDPSSARRCRYQHHPRLARTRLARHHQHLCRNRPRNEGKSPSQMRTRH